MKYMKAVLVVFLLLASIISVSAATVTVQPGSDGNDVWLEGTSNKNSYNFMIVGKQGSYEKKRSIMQFADLSSIPSGAIIDSAYLEVYYYVRSCGSDTPLNRTIAVHELKGWFNESAATSTLRNTGLYWNQTYVGLNNIDAKSNPETSALWNVNGYGWRSFNITELVSRWKSGSSANYGVLLWATNENLSGCDLRFYSSEYTTATYRPKLTVIYHMPVAFNYTMNMQPSYDTMTGNSTSAYVNTSLVSGTAETVYLNNTCPCGLSCSLSTTSGTPTFFSTLNLYRTGSTTPGICTVTVTGISASGLVKSTTFIVNVTAITPPPAFDYSLTMQPPYTTLSGNYTYAYVNASLVSGTSELVNLNYYGCPTGVICSLSTTSANPTFFSRLDLYRTNNTVPGMYSIFILGASSSGLYRNTTLYVNVTG